MSARGMLKGQERYQWSFLEELKGLPRPMLNRIVWIRREQPGSVEASLFYQDQHGITSEVYRAATEMEARELLAFLQSLSPQYEYWIDQAEDINATWIIIKSSSQAADQIVGRYPGRSGTEDVARRMSLADEAVYRVMEEAFDGRVGSAFVKGRMLRG